MIFLVKFLIVFLSTVFSLHLNYCHADGSFSKTGNSFVRVFQNDSISPLDSFPRHVPDYISFTEALLNNMIRDDRMVKTEQLHKFNLGLYQFFLSSAYELHYRRSLPEDPRLNLSDPVYLPNATTNGEPELKFYNVRVYGFPGFKNWTETTQRLESTEGDSYARNYTMLRTFPLDTTIITGYFNIFEDDYFFAYYIRNNTFKTTDFKLRTDEGRILLTKAEEYLNFEREDLLHTYQSTWEKYSIVNETLYKSLMSVTEQTWLPKLVTLMNEKLYLETVRANAAFATTHRRKIVESLLESAKHYIRMNHFSETFRESAFSFTTPDRPYERYQNLKVEGILNVANFFLDRTEIDNYLANRSVVLETVNFLYSDLNPAYVKFSYYRAGVGVIEKKYQIAAVSVMCAYNMITDQMPFDVSRKKDMFLNGSGFQITFHLLGFDRRYELVVRYIADRIAKIIGNVLDSEEDIFNMDYENVKI